MRAHTGMKTVYNPHVQSIHEKTKANLDEPISTYARTHARTRTRTRTLCVCHAATLLRSHAHTCTQVGEDERRGTDS